jgi:gluconate 2-dehydrogenase gamma chain
MATRRGFLAALAAGTASAWLTAHASELRAAGALAATATPADPYLVLTAEQVTVLDAVTSTLVPSDDLPGAREAHVVRFIDHGLATIYKEEREKFGDVMKAIAEQTQSYAPDAPSFAALSDQDRVAVLEQLEQSDPENFEWIRFATITGMFSNPSYGGNYHKSGWKMIGFDDRFIWSPPFGYYDRG